jgi:rhodanese-related sulfurtransferase
MARPPFQVTDPKGAASLASDTETAWHLVDVRTVEEFEAGHPAGAWNIPVAFAGSFGPRTNAIFVEAVAACFEPNDRLLLNCAVGARSEQACGVLAAAGFTQLVNVEGGFSGARDMLGRLREPGWLDCGLPVAEVAEPGRSWAEIMARVDQDSE